MTSRSEAEALRSLTETLRRLSSEHAALADATRIRWLSLEEGTALELLARQHSFDHDSEASRLNRAAAFYERLLAQAEERERASQDNQS